MTDNEQNEFNQNQDPQQPERSADSTGQPDGGTAETSTNNAGGTPKRSRRKSVSSTSKGSKSAGSSSNRSGTRKTASSDPATGTSSRSRSRTRSNPAREVEPRAAADHRLPAETPQFTTAQPALAGAFAGNAADVAYEMEVEIRNEADYQSSAESRDVLRFLAGLLRMIGENLERMTPPQIQTVVGMLKDAEVSDYTDRDFWQGIWMVVDYQIKEQTDFLQRRIRGEYETDAYGMDRELIDVVRPFFNFLYYTWWRTQTEGIEHIPAEGRALLVANHSGVLPWDGAMIATSVANAQQADQERIVRTLFLNWFNTLPFISPTLSALGQVPGLPDNAVRLLEEDQLVCVFPEGLKGVGKLFKDRYKLARFGRGGFVQAALRSGSPIIPVAVVGAEEIYPMLANFEPLARLLGLPYFPITPFFPWLGPLGAIPLPTRWHITYCPPISLIDYGPEDADDPLVVFTISEQVRGIIQDTLNKKIAERSSVF